MYLADAIQPESNPIHLILKRRIEYAWYCIFFLFFFSIVIVGCGGSGSSDTHIPMGNLWVTVDGYNDGSAIQDASVSVYDDKNLIVIKSTTAK